MDPLERHLHAQSAARFIGGERCWSRRTLDLAMDPLERHLHAHPPLDSSAASVVGAFSSAFFIRTPRVPPQHDSSEAAPAPAAFDICPVIYQTCGSSAALPVFACYLQAE